MTFNPRIAFLPLFAAALLAIPAAARAQRGAPATAQAAALEPRFNVSGFAVEGANPLTDEVTQKILKPYAGTHTGIERLQEAALALEESLRAAGFGFYRVVLPPQDIGGTIRLQIFKFPLGRVTVKGNQYFSIDNVLRGIPQLKGGETPNTQALARDLAVTNDNPSKRVDVTFKQGEAADTIDADVTVKDSRPWSGFAMLNNTGNQSTGRYRATFGLTHANLFDRDHQATLTYTLSPTESFEKVKQFGGYYKVPIYAWGGMLTAYFTYSSANSGVIANAFNVTGRGRFMGVQYTQHLPPVGDYRSYVSVGIDDKLFLNDKNVFAATGVPLTPNYRTNPVTISYTGRFEKKWGLAGYKVDYARNLPLGNGNSTSSYAEFDASRFLGANRVGASANWEVLRYSADASLLLPREWMLSLRLAGQHSLRRILVPGEQFGVGGAMSVRGLEERLVAGDTGLTTNVELWSPEVFTGTRLLAFYDYGRMQQYQAHLAPGSIERASLGSVGVGVRWFLGDRASASLDFAHVLFGLDQLTLPTFVSKTADRLHFNLMLRF